MSALRAHASFLSELSASALPPEVMQKAKDCLTDVLECVADAPADHRLDGIRHDVSLCHALQGARVWGEQTIASYADAAYANAARGAISYRNDLHRESASHAGSIVFAAAFAAAEYGGLRCTDVLTGAIAGYESMLCLGKILCKAHLSKALRSSALTASFGAASAAAVTLHLSEEQIISALSLSLQSAFGFNEWAYAGTGEDVFHAGNGARSGLHAAFCSAGGARCCEDALDGAYGMLACYGARELAPLLTEKRGTHFAITNVLFKPIEACLMVQAPAQCAARLFADGMKADTITQITAYVAAQALQQPGCDSFETDTLVQQKMNIRYGIACMLLFGAMQWGMPDRKVTELMRLIRLEEDPAFTAAFPARTPCVLTVRTSDGERVCQADDFQPLSSSAVRERFLHAPQMFHAPNADILRAVSRMDGDMQARDFTALL